MIGYDAVEPHRARERQDLAGFALYLLCVRPHLEWSTASPPPAWNFAVLPRVDEIDAFWAHKQRLLAKQDLPLRRHAYEPIEVPKNSPLSFVTAFFAVVTGFALIWHIWWMAGVGLLGAAVTLLASMFRAQDEVEIPAGQVGVFLRTHPVEVSL